MNVLNICQTLLYMYLKYENMVDISVIFLHIFSVHFKVPTTFAGVTGLQCDKLYQFQVVSVDNGGLIDRSRLSNVSRTPSSKSCEVVFLSHISTFFQNFLSQPLTIGLCSVQTRNLSRKCSNVTFISL